MESTAWLTKKEDEENKSATRAAMDSIFITVFDQAGGKKEGKYKKDVVGDVD